MPDPDRGPLQGSVKYNPHLWGDDELRSIFVARNRELAELLNRLRQTPAGTVPQHVLVVGQRGMGKTTLLRRLALGVRDDPELSRQWIALTFPEEQFTVSNLADLWSNVLDALTDALENESTAQAELEYLDGEIHRIEALPLPEREDATISMLDDWIDQHQRRILLLIDSTDLLFDSLGGSEDGKRGQKAADKSLWRLRKTLAHHSGFFWLGTSYQALESSLLYSDAFRDFFELVELRPLSVDDMRQAMLALARTFGAGQEKPGEVAAQVMARILDAKPERLKALRNLTGGNPRTTVMLYELFATDRQENLHADIKLLLDLMTPLYKARMENLAAQPRKRLAHGVEHWAPIDAAKLAAASSILASTVSGQLTRLEAEGLIEKVRLTGRRRAGYQVAERFFNIWYLTRYTSRRVRQSLMWLIEFMRLWYSSDELRSLASKRANAHIQGRFCDADQLEHSRAIAAALGDDLLEKYRLELSVFSVAKEEALRLHRPIPEIFPNLFDLDGADKFFSTRPNPWNDLGLLLQYDLDYPNEAEVAYRKAIALDPKAALPWSNLGLLLARHLGRDDEAEAAYRQAIALDPKDALPWNNLGDLLQHRPGRYDEAEAVYQHARQLDPNHPYPAANHARLLARMDKRVEASAAFRQAADLAASLAKPEESADYWDILLQAHLWLGNHDSASQALESLADRASGGDALALFRVREQARECHGIGMGPALAELMEQSPHASFLKPIALALRAAAGEAEALDGIPPELRTMAEEVMRDILAQDRKAVGG